MTSHKIVVVGAGNVGKTAYLKKISPSYKAIMDIRIHSVKIGDDTLNVWDLTGLSDQHDYYHGAVGAVVMYDVTDKRSYEYVPFLIDDLAKKGISNVTVCGNKCDEKNAIGEDAYDTVYISVKMEKNLLEPLERVMRTVC